ncbi:MAG: PIG-L family deacetylase [Rhodospirillales bacterium]
MGKLLLLILSFAVGAGAQPNLSGEARIRLALKRLNTLGSVLMIGAHPDDEHTATLAYLARGRGIRAAYLSLTRGEGGQNLIGPERDHLLGLIRTEELLAAREIDGAEQYFTRAIDFGFSKSVDEALAKWGRETILADVVWNIRRFRPDVVILCFSDTASGGHGHHQASAVLGKEAFTAAANPSRFPEQLKNVRPWQARRLLWNVFGRAPGGSSSMLEIETGAYNPLLGYSYNEIAGMSRSMHRSQAMGSPQRRGAATASLVVVAGEPAAKDLFENIDTSWNRIEGGTEIGRILAEAERSFDPARPEKIVPLLLDARRRITALGDFWAREKLGELDEAAALCAGLWLDASADRYEAAPGSTVTIRATALNRSSIPIQLAAVTLHDTAPVDAELPFNQPLVRDFQWKVPEDAAYSQPYWLREAPKGEVYSIPDQQLVGAAENPPVLEARFKLRIGAEEIELTRPVIHRYVDRLRGELTRPFVIAPPIALRFAEPVLVLPGSQRRKFEVVVRGSVAGASGEVTLDAPAGWKIEPAVRKFQLGEPSQEQTLSFEAAAAAGAAPGWIRATAVYGSQRISSGIEVIAHPHIGTQTVFPEAAVKAVRVDAAVLAKNIGYVAGAGDEVPQALRQLGCNVTFLEAEDLAGADLSRFDAIVTGIRAYNVRADLRANQHRLLEYVRAGGTLVVQYITPDGQTVRNIGPFPLRISRDRVSVEEAPVTFPDPDSALLRQPNRITSADFDGWVQERGLYFAEEGDPRYNTLFESHDPGEPPRPGGTLYARYGKGVYVFTAYSWFRQLPAGVPGAFRIFANLLSAGKVLP